jgi:hypothetical protein
MDFKKRLILFFLVVSFSHLIDCSREKCKNLDFNTKFNNLFHHFLSNYSWFGSIIFGYHEIHLIFILMVFTGWKLLGDKCFITLNYNESCGYDKNKGFDDLFSNIYKVLGIDNYIDNGYHTIMKSLILYDILMIIKKYI